MSLFVALWVLVNAAAALIGYLAFGFLVYCVFTELARPVAKAFLNLARVSRILN